MYYFYKGLEKKSYESLEDALIDVVIDFTKDGDWTSVSQISSLLDTGEFDGWDEKTQKSYVSEFFDDEPSIVQGYHIEKAEDICGTYKIGSLLKIKYRDLRKLFGDPTSVGSGDGKVRFEWDLKIDGVVITIYDWKTEGEPRDQIDEWSVGGYYPSAMIILESYLKEVKSKGLVTRG